MDQLLPYGRTPLHVAAERNDLSRALQLLQQGARVDARDEFGNTALWCAVFASKGQGEMIALLRKHGADPLAANHSGVTPLSLARNLGVKVWQFFSDVPDGPPRPPPVARPSLHADDLLPVPTGDYNWKQEIERLFQILVPVSGQAATVQGEIIRAAMKITDEVYRNGGANWDDGFKRLARFIVEVLNDEQTFSYDDRKAIVHAVGEVLRFKTDLTGEGKPCYLLSEFAVRWCFAHPKLTARKLDPKLKR